MDVKFNKAENRHIVSDYKWIARELDVDFPDDACCEDRAYITHIATLSGRNEHPVNQYSVEIIQDHGFGRQDLCRVYKVSQYREWKDIREGHFNELLAHA